MKTSELTGAHLDYAVAVAAGRWRKWVTDEARPLTSIIDIGANEDGECSVYVYGRKRDPYVPWKPSTDWSQGGPIIEREKIWLKFPVAVGPVEAIHGLHLFPNTVHGFGPTPLIAAMRCYVVSKLGHEIEIPEDIL